VATTIRDLLVKLGVKADSRAALRFDKSIAGVKRRMALAVAGATALGGAIVGLTLKFAKSGDEAAKRGKQIKITAEEYQQLSFAMERAGGTSADVEKALKRQAKLSYDLSRGLSTAVEAFDAIGLKQKDIKGLGQAELFTKIAESLREVKDETRQVALAEPQPEFVRREVRALNQVRVLEPDDSAW